MTNLILWGLIFNFVGSLVLILVTLFGKWHQKIIQNIGQKDIGGWGGDLFSR